MEVPSRGVMLLVAAPARNWWGLLAFVMAPSGGALNPSSIAQRVNAKKHAKTRQGYEVII